MQEFIVDNKWIIYASLALIALFIFITFLFRNKTFRFHVADRWNTLPIFGNINQWAKNATPFAENPKWTIGERALCASYKPYFASTSKEEFERHTEFLRIVGDAERKPTPIWMLIFLFILVILESAGFAALMSSDIAENTSANQQIYISYGLAFVVGSILFYLTHSTGHEWYRATQLKARWHDFNEDKRDNKNAKYRTESIDLRSDQFADKNSPEYLRFTNRVAKSSSDRGAWSQRPFFWGTLALVVLIAFFSTTMRWAQGKDEGLAEKTQQSQMYEADPFSSASSSTRPLEVEDSQNSADEAIAQEREEAISNKKFSSYLLLAVIFVFTQFMGVKIGYSYGFISKQSEEAYEKLQGFASYDEMHTMQEPFRDIVNARLITLQQKMEHISSRALHLSKTFDDYLYETSSKGREIEKQKENQTSTTITLGDIQQEIENLNDPEKEKIYFQQLSPEWRKNPELRQWLQQRKTERENRLQENDTEDLF